jgi:Asp-tRNA(Asn)/Glu-tRNA(Gln) amidotransferase C subunit
MFISNLEKSRIEARLKLLEERVEQLGRSLNAALDQMSQLPQVKTSEQIAEIKASRQRAHSKAHYYRKKAEKAAAAAAQTTQPTQE